MSSKSCWPTSHPRGPESIKEVRKEMVTYHILPKFTLVTEVEVEVLAGGGLEINRVGVSSNLLAGMNKGK